MNAPLPQFKFIKNETLSTLLVAFPSYLSIWGNIATVLDLFIGKPDSKSQSKVQAQNPNKIQDKSNKENFTEVFLPKILQKYK